MDRASVVQEFAKQCLKVGIDKRKVDEGFASVLSQLSALDPPKNDAVVCAVLNGDDLIAMATSKEQAEIYRKERHGLIMSHEWFYYMGH